jgi:tetratricopeptide (TPR) repeat protein
MRRRPGAACVRLGVALALASTLLGQAVRADPPADRPPRPELPLSPLPDPPRLELTTPTRQQLADLDELLTAVASREVAERDAARSRLEGVPRDLVPAIARRIDTIAESSDRRAMSKLLDRIRDEARDAVRSAMKARGEKGPVDTPDYLEMLSEHARADDPSWAPLIRVVALSRMLTALGTIEATRELVRIRVRFEFLRRDVQLLLDRLGDRALPAVIEAQKHAAPEVGRWATGRLDLLGKAIPSETIQTEDPEILADILRAYGRIRDPDAARVIISFANSERTQIRLAARQAVRMLGDVADWQLRDTFENIVGRKPPREWSWERTARELFTEFDRLRLSRVYEFFGEGKAAHEAGKLDEAVAAFDAVLARSPEFEHSAEMVPAYVAYARKHLDDAPDRARRALGRARRLVGDGLEGKPLESLLLTLEAEELLETGVADQVLLRRALELDPENARAQSLLDRIQRGDLEERTWFNRYVTAGAIGVLALLAIVLVVLRRPRGMAVDSANGSKNDGARAP